MKQLKSNITEMNPKQISELDSVKLELLVMKVNQAKQIAIQLDAEMTQYGTKLLTDAGLTPEEWGINIQDRCFFKKEK